MCRRCLEPPVCEAALWVVSERGGASFRGYPPGKTGGGINAGLGGRSSLDDFSPSVGALQVAFSSMHGSTSYTRCCNVAVCLLVGDVSEATVVLIVAVLLRGRGTGAGLKLQGVRLGAAAGCGADFH